MWYLYLKGKFSRLSGVRTSDAKGFRTVNNTNKTSMLRKKRHRNFRQTSELPMHGSCRQPPTNYRQNMRTQASVLLTIVGTFDKFSKEKVAHKTVGTSDSRQNLRWSEVRNQLPTASGLSCASHIRTSDN